MRRVKESDTFTSLRVALSKFGGIFRVTFDVGKRVKRKTKNNTNRIASVQSLLDAVSCFCLLSSV